MNLTELLSQVGLAHGDCAECEVTGVVANSRKVSAGSVFVCIQGGSFDGHSYAADAIEKGACLVVAQRDLGLPRTIVVEDTRAVYGPLCAAYQGYPAKKMKVVGVTGTNGKTTSTALMKQILEHAGHRVGLIGTIQNQIGDLVLPSKFTTPEPDELHALFANMAQAGCSHVIMEVSSQALAQGRLAGVHFDVAGFTNLTQDHLDYHGTMEQYFAAKAELFQNAEIGITNIDDEYGRKLLERADCEMLTYGAEHGADFQAIDQKPGASGVQFTLKTARGEYPVQFSMPGLFSVYNALAVAAMCSALGLRDEEIAEGLGICRGVYGRAEVIYDGEFTVLCDYAHTSDGLENLLSTIRPFAEKRLVVLFGCAGRRDRTKRPLMAKTVAKYADFMVITSDNPRDEDPYEILEDTIVHVRGGDVPYHLEVDRYYAILWALEHAEPGDVIALCGKGHENYQVLGDVTVYFDEHEIVKHALAEKGLI